VKIFSIYICFLIKISRCHNTHHFKTIRFFARLGFGHTLFPFHSCKITLNNSLLRILHNTSALCDINHILFDCPILSLAHSSFFSLLSSFKIPFNTRHILSSQSRTVILGTISFFHNSGLLISNQMVNIIVKTKCLLHSFNFNNKYS